MSRRVPSPIEVSGTAAAPIAMPSMDRDRRRGQTRGLRQVEQIADRLSPRGAASGSKAEARRGRPSRNPKPGARDRDERGEDRQDRGRAGGNGQSLAQTAPRPSPTASPSSPPAVETSTASARNASRTCRRPAPTAFSRPISRVRSVTDTSITFMMPTPATASGDDAIPASARVSTRRIAENAVITASWVMHGDVLGRVPLATRAATTLLTRGRASERVVAGLGAAGGTASVRLKIRIAVATGMKHTSSKSKPSERPRGDSTPTTRKRCGADAHDLAQRVRRRRTARRPLSARGRCRCRPGRCHRRGRNAPAATAMAPHRRRARRWSRSPARRDPAAPAHRVGGRQTSGPRS